MWDAPDSDFEFTESVIVRRDTQTFRVHKEVKVDVSPIMIVEYDPGFLRADDAWLDGELNMPVAHGYLRTEKDGNDQNPMEEDREHEFTVVAVDEEVELNAGTFTTVHIRRERTTGALAGEVVEHWYAPGVGKVQEHRIANAGLMLEGSWEKLIDYSVPGGG
jgi:hypothetical protein